MASGRRTRARVGRARTHARESPAPSPGGALPCGLVAVGLAAARPNEGEALAVLVVEEVGVNRRVEAGIVQLDREVVAALVRALGPGGPDLGLMRRAA